MPDPSALWERYRRLLYHSPELGLRLDPSRIGFDEAWIEAMEPSLERAFAAMAELEAGAIANPDEGRRVGHYWLRDPDRAPDRQIRDAIRTTLERVRAFAGGVHAAAIAPPGGGRFQSLLLIGIGGSALGPQLLADALGSPSVPLRPFFLDNTDPDGFDRTFAALDAAPGGLGGALVVVISKSGGTPETRNGQEEARGRFERAGLPFPRHAVAITGVGSALDKTAVAEGWLERFPMWDWVGGRTSITSAVGLLPMALLGLDLDAFLAGARATDAATRVPEARSNPAALLALAWHHATGGRGERDMVVLPYKDRLALFSRYLQQLVMESLGKERDLAGKVVRQGIAVYGNKGSTDQHAYVQQLRDGVPNFFVTFLEVLRDREGGSPEVEPGITAGDYLHGFLLGTRRALFESSRPSLTLTVPRGDAFDLGVLVALYERAVGLYATLVGINAYHQPGVEAGKQAAAAVLALQRRLLAALECERGRTATELARAIGAEEEAETAFALLERLSANPSRGVTREPGATPTEARYRRGSPS
jgi:glucose-6-phosphate isomerase